MTILLSVIRLNIFDIQPDQRGLGVVFQDYAVWPHMTVFDNIAYPLKFKNLDKETLRAQVMEVVALVNLTGLEQRMPSQLSGGQQQRVALARDISCQTITNATG